VPGNVRQSTGEVRRWVVAGAVLERPDGLLLVRNRRRNGRTDWSTPGGVIDDSDPTLLEGLAREVEEETGLRVCSWEGPLYEVRADAVDLGWSMRCEVYRALEFDGELKVADPDGIVIEAAFVPHIDCHALLENCLAWVREPLADWLTHRWEASERRDYRYDVRGTALDNFEVVRSERPGTDR